MSTESPRAKLVLEKHEAMKTARLGADSWHQLIAEFVIPRKANITSYGDVNGTQYKRLRRGAVIRC